MRIAYLTNQYPLGSHTFIRREIIALESLGHQVDRYSIRHTTERLDDESDRSEAARTHALLDAGWAGLGGALFRSALSNPERLWSASKLALALGRRSERGFWRHF